MGEAMRTERDSLLELLDGVTDQVDTQLAMLRDRVARGDGHTQFVPGERVRCETRPMPRGRTPVLVAVERVADAA
jgi:hypothetical protein